MKNNKKSLLLAVVLTFAPLLAMAQLPLPYQNGFEQYAGGSIYEGIVAPSDWTATGTFEYDLGFFSIGVFPGVTADLAHLGSNSLTFMAVAGSDNFIATPLLDHDADELLISFWLAVSTSGGLTVGVMTDPADTTTFVAVQDVQCIESSGSSDPVFAEQSIVTEGLDIAGPVAIAFRFTSTANPEYDNASWIFIDDLMVSANTDCEPPTFLTVGETTYNSAQLSWTGTSDLGFEVRYNTSGDVNDPATVTFTAPASPVTLTGLDHGTVYYAWVSTLCEGEVSPIMPVSPFSTDTACYTLASAEVTSVTASSAALSWTYLEAGEPHAGVDIRAVDLTDTTAAPIETAATGISTFVTGLVEGHLYAFELRTLCDTFSAEPMVLHAVPSGTPCAESSVEGSTQNSYRYPIYSGYEHSASLMLYREADLAGVSEINAIALRTTNAVPTYAHNVSVYMAATADSVVSAVVSLDTLVQVADSVEVHAWNAGWMYIPLDTTFSVVPGQNLYIALLNDNDDYAEGYGDEPFVRYGLHAAGYQAMRYRWDEFPFGTDTVSFTAINELPDMRFYGECAAPVCEPPSVTVGAVETGSISVSWLNELSGLFLPQVRAVGDTAWTSLATTTGHEATFDNLEPATAYLVRVGNICPGGDTAFCPALSAWTLCVAVSAPHTYSFMQTIDHCWTTAPDVTVSNAGPGGYVALETSYGTQRNWMVTPELEDPIETLQLRIRANDYWNRDSVLSIGACNADGSGVEWIDHVHVPYSTTVYSEFVVRLNAYDGDKHHIILRSGNMRLRQVAIEPLDPCAQLTDLELDTATTTAATLSWTDVNNAGNYQIEYRTADDTVASWTALTADTVRVSISGLDAGTRYTVRVRALCSLTDTSLWSSLSFITECDAVSEFPWTEGFEGQSNHCWHMLGYNTTEIDDWKIATTDPHSGSSYAYSQKSAAQTSDEWLVSPVINLPADDALELEWWGRNPSGNIGYYSSYIVLVSPTASLDRESFVDTLEVVDADAEWTLHSVSLADYDGPVRIAFRHNGFNGGGVRIDDIAIMRIELPGCVPPTDLTANRVSEQAASVSWTPGNDYHNAWQLEVADADGSNVRTFEASSIPYIVSGLSLGSTYSLRVRTNCGNGVYSNWTDPLTYVHESDGIDAAEASAVRLYPNPATTSVAVEAGEMSEVSILDISGREVYCSPQAALRHCIDLVQLARGSYFVRVTASGTATVRKLTVR